ncbi:HD domain-containing protein [Candidatus Dependentiae bacterium]|nr:HD domain-containing protein [Candidatus Dependentiae bacterium]
MLIEIDSLLNDCITNFNLYILNEENYVLFRSSNLPFTEKHKQNLLSKKLKIYINASDYQKYLEYIKNNISNLKNNNDLSIEIKNKYFYESSKIVINNIFESPDNTDLKNNVQILAETAVDLLKDNDYNLQNILKVIQFEYSTLTHSLNVSLIISNFAKLAGYDEKNIPLLIKGALLHDIGKSRIDKAVLLKPGKLDKHEWDEMKKHPLYGVNIVKSHEVKEKIILDCIMYHHEKFDGSGYPFNLPYSEIPLEAQLVAVCDVFDALTTRRCYKNALGSFPAFRIMLNEMEGSFNKDLLHIFINMFKTE